MSQTQFLLLLNSILCSAKYAPLSSFSLPEILPHRFNGDVFPHTNSHYQERRLGEIDSYREHRYYEITVRDGHTHDYGWKEINETGIRSSVSDVDDILFERISLSDWSFPFYGHLHDEMYISANGFVTVMPDYAEGPCGRYFCQYGGNYYSRYLAPLMTDWNPSASNKSQVFYQFGTDSSSGQRHLIVEWEAVTLYAENNSFGDSPFTFQAIFEEDGDIIFNYRALPFNPSIEHYPMIIGIEDSFIWDGTGEPWLDGTQWSYFPLKLGWENITHNLGRSIQISASPTCNQFTTCSECVNYTLSNEDEATSLKCGWCGAINVCSDSVGREVASRADVCMTKRKQMQKNVDQCLRYAAVPCGSNNASSESMWPITEPGKKANRACSFTTKISVECPAFACFETRSCDLYGLWGNITTWCDKNQSLIPCPAEGVWKITYPGNISTVPCAGESGGKVVRACNFYGQWSVNDSTACRTAEAIAGTVITRMNTGQISGLVIGCILGAILLCVLLILVSKQKRQLNKYKNLQSESEMQPQNV